VKLGEVIDDENLGDAYGQQKPLDAFWSINQMQIEKEAGVGRAWVIKHRHGRSRFMIYIEINSATLAINEISKDEYQKRRKVVEQTREVSGSEKTQEELKTKQMYERSKISKGANPLQALASNDYVSSDVVDNIVKPAQ
jgi:hypothetical protein